MTDLLLTDAHVLTMDPERPRAGAIEITGGRTVAVHESLSAHTARDLGARETRSLDGLTVTPGFHDAHNHMAWASSRSTSTPPVQSLDDLYAAVRARAETLGPDEWVVGSGYDQNKIGGHPEREALERAADGRKSGSSTPVGTCAWSARQCSTSWDSPTAHGEVDGGVVGVDASGRPTGLLQERAQTLVADLVMPYPLAALEDAIESAGRRYLAEGITSATEAGIGGGWIGKAPLELAGYQNAYASGRLPVRVDLMIAHDALHTHSAHEDDAMSLGLDLGIRTGFGDDAMRRRIVEAHRSGWRVAAHAIGDAAVELVLDAYEQAQRESPRPDVRHRIEPAAPIDRSSKGHLCPACTTWSTNVRGAGRRSTRPRPSPRRRP